MKKPPEDLGIWAYRFSLKHGFEFKRLNKGDHIRVKNPVTGLFVDFWSKGSVRTASGEFLTASRSGKTKYSNDFIKGEIEKLVVKTGWKQKIKNFFNWVLSQ